MTQTLSHSTFPLPSDSPFPGSIMAAPRRGAGSSSMQKEETQVTHMYKMSASPSSVFFKEYLFERQSDIERGRDRHRHFPFYDSFSKSHIG